MKNRTNCENNIELLLLETWHLLDGYMKKKAKFALNIIGWVETL